MNLILSEKEYQHYIMDYLVKNNEYIIRENKHFNKYYSLDKELLFNFLYKTQPEEMQNLKKIYKDDLEDIIINYINNKIMETSLIEVLKSDNLEISNIKIKLLYSKPATKLNQKLMSHYNDNIFSIMEEVWANDNERVDLVVFINGFSIINIELKCNPAGQSYEDAIEQFRTSRNPESRLFKFKYGSIVNFAMDLEEVHMTTKICGEKTFFLPFNIGNGSGVDCGKGNPVRSDKFPVHYMWEDILKRETLIELLSKFIFIERIEKPDPITEKIKKSENIIFPRYHQLDCLRKTLKDISSNNKLQNYLIQHSAGSGKTYTISWLAHRLSSLHYNDDSMIYDNIIIVTDRVIVDRQLQKAVTSLEHKSGLIKIMDDKCSSGDLKIALEGNTKIIATTIQKFLYIADITRGLRNKKFAVIIDEAHSSTSGKDMAAITKTLSSTNENFNNIEDLISTEITSHGKQENVSVFAFTATPKPTTLQLFGRLNKQGFYEAFHLYSMKQAIEEGFILDVLQNYTPYETFYKINKDIDEDPKYNNNVAKKQIARFARLHETNINQRIEIIIEHFRNCVMDELDGQAKAMVISSSIVEAIKYYQAFLDYVKRKGYDDISPLVAFSGKISANKLGIDSDADFSESSINGFSDNLTAEKFDGKNYQVLLVANKYQTGFDQPKLCAMYVLKKLNNVNAVQTLSRLNRICPPYDKKTFILDFANNVEDIENAFKPYYTTTILSNSVNPTDIYELDEKINSYYILDENDINTSHNYFYDNKKTTGKREINITFYLSKSKKLFNCMDEKNKHEFLTLARKFIRLYEFIVQVSNFKDIELHKKYSYLCWLLPYINMGATGKGFSLNDKIIASDFFQKKGEEHNMNIIGNPCVKLPTTSKFNLSEDDEKKLSEIIEEVNSKTGKSFDNDIAIRAALQIKDLMLKNDGLKASAANNTVKDFEFSYFDNIDDVLLDGRSQNQEFFDLLLKNEKIRNDVLGLFIEEIYNNLRNKK